jgi:adenylosuccinate lyase
MQRNRTRLLAARENIATGAISGVGPPPPRLLCHIDPFGEEYFCSKMGLKPEPVSTHVNPRDRHAEFFCTLSIIASTMSASHRSASAAHRVLEARNSLPMGRRAASPCRTSATDLS